MRKASKVLQEARSLIDRPSKWCKGGFFCGEKFCAFGAIMSARLDKPSFAGMYLAAAIGVLWPSNPGGYAWNDAPERTHADVMTAYDVAISLAVSDEAGK